MAGITQAAFDAAVEQAKREGAEAAAAIIEKLRTERDAAWATIEDYRAKMHAMGERLEAYTEAKMASGQRSIGNAVQANKGGRWRDRPRTVRVLAVLTAIALLALFWMLLL